MLTIRQTWEALVKEVRQTDLFRDVRQMPVQRVNDARFLQEFPGLVAPACLVVFLGRTTEIKGGSRDNGCRWSAVIVDKDPGGKAIDETTDLADRLVDAVLDQQIKGNELTILGSHDVAVSFANPRFSVLEVTFSTREAAAR